MIFAQGARKVTNEDDVAEDFYHFMQSFLTVRTYVLLVSEVTQSYHGCNGFALCSHIMFIYTLHHIKSQHMLFVLT